MFESHYCSDESLEVKVMMLFFGNVASASTIWGSEKFGGTGESRCFGYPKIALFLKLIVCSHFKRETFGVMSKREFRARSQRRSPVVLFKLKVSELRL